SYRFGRHSVGSFRAVVPHGPGDRLKAKEGVVEVSTVAVGTRSFQFFSRNASFSQSSQYSPLLALRSAQDRVSVRQGKATDLVIASLVLRWKQVDVARLKESIPWDGPLPSSRASSASSILRCFSWFLGFLRAGGVVVVAVTAVRKEAKILVYGMPPHKASTIFPLSLHRVSSATASALAVLIGIAVSLVRPPPLLVKKKRMRDFRLLYCFCCLLCFCFPHHGPVMAQAFTGTFGINYGRIADNIPPPESVVTLLKAAKIKNVRIYDADHNVLNAFKGSGLDLVVSVSNDHLKDMKTLLGAIKSVYNALKRLQLADDIMVSTPHSQAVFVNSFPPSSCTFKEDTNLHYDNMFDAQIDAAYAALEAAGFDKMEVRVSETGWASSGDENEPGATTHNARTYNYNLRKRLFKKKGTPLRPKIVVKAYLFALFNENQKPGASSEKHYGLFKADGSISYDIGFTGLKPSCASPSLLSLKDIHKQSWLAPYSMIITLAVSVGFHNPFQTTFYVITLIVFT
ncbi:unnamed protein product, partial [Musa hybrid cultivar]